MQYYLGGLLKRDPNFENYPYLSGAPRGVTHDMGSFQNGVPFGAFLYLCRTISGTEKGDPNLEKYPYRTTLRYTGLNIMM